MEIQNLAMQSLTDIWCMVLNIESVGPRDNFFEVGGDSLLALVMIEQIKQRLGWELNLAELLRNPTIEDLYANLSQPKISNLEKMIVRLSKRGEASPVIFIHPVSGLIFAYSKLVKHLGRNRACYGIQSSFSKNLESNTIPQMAETYADIIYDELGEDEFNLCGWSSGGVVSYEIARVAADKGLNLKKLIMIDSYSRVIDFSSSLFSGETLILDRTAILKEFYKDIMAYMVGNESSGKASIRYVENSEKNELFKDADQVFNRIASALFGEHFRKQGSEIQFIRQLFETYKSNLVASVKYEVTPANVSCLLLHSPENDTVDSWKQNVKGGFTSIALSGNHYDLMGENCAGVVALHMKAYMDKS